MVLIVDESVAARYLDINAAGGVPTALSRVRSGVEIHNYGVAASITNCSVGSNMTLRYGGTRSDYQRINAVQPSIWAYARKAGLRTVYIDAQRTGGALQNMMTASERAEIDSFIQFDDVPVEQRDMAAARVLIAQLADPRPKFVLINKVGAHFPVHDKYPDDHLHHLPAMPRGNFRHIADTGETLGFTGSPQEWRRYRNSYRNTIAWKVGAFFDKLLRDADFTDTTLIYTSDHGQNLHERGDPGLYTHCSPTPQPEEGAVPLVIIDGAPGSGMDWKRNHARNRDRSSHYMIYPTLLALMGYDRDATEARYGRPLDAPSIDPMSFNTLFNARLNRKPTWLKVDPTRLAKPPASDVARARQDNVLSKQR